MNHHISFAKSNGYRNSLPDNIANYLLRKIFTGEFSQGDRLIESEIAKELSVSNIPVREAFYILQNTGIIERLPRKGVRIKAMSKQEVLDYKIALIEMYKLGVEHSQSKWTDEKHRQLLAYLQEATDQLVTGDVLEYVLKCDQLSKYIFEVANNKALLRFYTEIAYITKVYCQIQWDREQIKEYHAYITATVDAILDGEYEQAKKQLETLTRESLTV